MATLVVITCGACYMSLVRAWRGSPASPPRYLEALLGEEVLPYGESVLVLLED